jgi:hypothetical protein
VSTRRQIPPVVCRYYEHSSEACTQALKLLLKRAAAEVGGDDGKEKIKDVPAGVRPADAADEAVQP